MKKYVIFIGFLILLNHLLYPFLIYSVEKTSFIWTLIKSRKLTTKEYDYLFLGDSQIMSGISPDYFQKLSNDNSKILFYPRPSEQIEGILFLLENFYNEGFRFKKIILNISPITVSKNNILESHKSLMNSFYGFHLKMYEPSFFKFYFKNISNSVYYLLIQLFPLLKLNSNFNSELRLIPGTEGITQNNSILPFIESNLLGNLVKNRTQNYFLKKELTENNFYYEWGKTEANSKKCIPETKEKKLPLGIEYAFNENRIDSLNRYKDLIKLAKNYSSKIYLLHIPFSPTAEKLLHSELNIPLNKTLNELNTQKINILRIPTQTFFDEDFIDYTHLNYCGMEKLTKTIFNIVTTDTFD